MKKRKEKERKERKGTHLRESYSSTALVMSKEFKSPSRMWAPSFLDLSSMAAREEFEEALKR